jgi:arylsulfatase A-like enzyme
MNRRSFLSGIALSRAALYLPVRRNLKTRHVIFIVNGGGARKKDYYENAALSPNIRRLAREGFVFEEDHCEAVASHDAAFTELLQGRHFDAGSPAYPTILDYLGNGSQTRSLETIPRIMEQYGPRIVVCQKTTHDVGHHDYEDYLRAVKATDDAIGGIFNWVKSHPYFRGNTAIVIRPEFGRDDELNGHGDLHHSYGFYYTHRVASIFWGPDFNRAVDRKTVISSLDMAPTLTRLFGVDAIHAQGRVVPGLFRTYTAN